MPIIREKKNLFLDETRILNENYDISMDQCYSDFFPSVKLNKKYNNGEYVFL